MAGGAQPPLGACRAEQEPAARSLSPAEMLEVVSGRSLAAVSKRFQMAPGSWHQLRCSIRGKLGVGSDVPAGLHRTAPAPVPTRLLPLSACSQASSSAAAPVPQRGAAPGRGRATYRRGRASSASSRASRSARCWVPPAPCSLTNPQHPRGSTAAVGNTPALGAAAVPTSGAASVGAASPSCTSPFGRAHPFCSPPSLEQAGPTRGSTEPPQVRHQQWVHRGL